MDVFDLVKPKGEHVPVIISSPHSGTEIPINIRNQFADEPLQTLDDTDFHIHKLYDFAPDLGITLLSANLSRWVIDLNRSPDSTPLYSDGRVITGLVPETDFNGNALYKNRPPDAAEIERRKEHYYLPYHQMLSSLIRETYTTFGIVLLFDAHSIRQVVPGIQKAPFPDLILGDADGNSASELLSETALEALSLSDYEVSHNYPFKGGYITRTYGKPASFQHALQLEMVKRNYMDNTETKYDPQRADKIRVVLQNLFTELIKQLI